MSVRPKAHDYIVDDDRQFFEENLVKPALESGRSSATVRMRHFQTNEPILVDMRFFDLPDHSGSSVMYFMAFAKDLHDYLVNQKLRFLSERIQSQAKIGGWELDIDTGKTVWTEQIYEIYGLPADTPTDKVQGISFYGPQDQPRISQYVEKCISKGEAYDDVFEFFDTHETDKWVRSTGTAIRNHYGHPFR